jgi:hypothetical protein
LELAMECALELRMMMDGQDRDGVK